MIVMRFIKKMESSTKATNHNLILSLFLAKGEKVVRREVCAITSKGTDKIFIKTK